MKSHRASNPLVLTSSDHEKEHHEQGCGIKADPRKDKSSVHISTGTLHCLFDDSCGVQITLNQDVLLMTNEKW